MKKFKVFEGGIETLVEADNIVTMKDGSYRLYRDKRLIACIGSNASWVEVFDGNDKSNDKDDEGTRD